MIGLVLAYAKPKIEELQDKAIIEQSIGMMEDINAVILSIIQGGAGNTRLIELGIKKGFLKIDGEMNEIIFEIESSDAYSQPGKDIYYGGIILHTEKIGEINKITLTNSYNEYNLTYQGKDKIKLIGKASTPYKLFISNKGRNNNKTIIDIDIV